MQIDVLRQTTLADFRIVLHQALSLSCFFPISFFFFFCVLDCSRFPPFFPAFVFFFCVLDC